MSTPRFCSQCGAPLTADARFCNQCGSRVVQPPVASPPVAGPQYGTPPPPPAMPLPAAAVAPPAPVYAAPAAAQAPAEPILTVLALVQRTKGFLGMGRDSFSLIVTPGRLVFVAVSDAQRNQAITAAREGAKQSGKGWMGQVAAQMAWLQLVLQSYQNVPVETLIAQTPGSFFLPLTTIRQIRFDTDDDGEGQPIHRMSLDTTTGKHRFQLAGITAHDAKKQLRPILGQLVR